MANTEQDFSGFGDGAISGTIWTALTGTLWEVTSGDCSPVTGTEGNVIELDDGNGDDTGGAYLSAQFAEMIIDENGRDCGCALHIATDQAYVLTLDSSGNIDMYRWNGGSSYTLRAGNMGSGTTYGAGDVLRLEYDGTDTYEALIDTGGGFTSLGTYTNSEYGSNGGGPGMHAFGTTNGGNHCSYFNGGDDFGGGGGSIAPLIMHHMNQMRN